MQSASLPTIALLGNPNTGKSTLFNALTGSKQRVANYPGVTVEKKLGWLTIAGQKVTLIDLPGTYSLAPRSPDEMVAVDVLLGRRQDTPQPQLVVCVVDASNLERNLYLVSQVLSCGLPAILALNMADVAAQRGVEIDVPAVQRQLGIPVVSMEAIHRVGISELKTAIGSALAHGASATLQNENETQHRHAAKMLADQFPAEFHAEVSQLAAVIRAAVQASTNGTAGSPAADSKDAGSPAAWPAFLYERLLLDSGGYLEKHLPEWLQTATRPPLEAARARLAAAGHPVPACEAVARYGWISQVLDGNLRRAPMGAVTRTDSIDRVLTHRVWGSLIFLGLMLLLFQAVFSWSAPLMEALDGWFSSMGYHVSQHLPEGPLQALVADGIFAGVGGVLVFLPQILVLFAFLGVLEDCGYMARAAYLMDKLMVRVGLSGKSFIPLMSSFACAVPGVMAARVIENPRDRLKTILIAPLMSCSARLPIYGLLIAAFIPNASWLGGTVQLQGLVMFGLYLLGMLAAVIVAWTLGKTILKGETPPFVMELPPYKLPSLKLVFTRMLERGWTFVRRAGTLILAVSVVVWAALYFPHDPNQLPAELLSSQANLKQRLNELTAAPVLANPLPAGENAAATAELESVRGELAAVESRIDREFKRHSYLGRAGRLIEPAVRPLGWDWRIGCAVIASFPAREVVVSSMGVMFEESQAAPDENDGLQLQTALKQATFEQTGQPLFNVPVALSLLVFFVLCCQCVSTLVVIQRETNSWKWPTFTFVYMTGLAYVGALVVYQVGMWLSGASPA